MTQNGENLEDVKKDESSTPVDTNRSYSTVSAPTESADNTNDEVTIARLIKRRQEIEEQLSYQTAQLLESLREEWVSGRISLFLQCA